ncbi:helix-turn-helix domain-containing protein [Nocardia farcinica]|uniref:helix-turn-helix transcriptional regulator n=1 Tax=Nocardia farcinica TaxID=37329 RepID=UPI001895EA0A|nr:helix-turn-helix transcriptional regulator [Nocardia farcinica]MBF6422656.1 helix-turn-helix domain-containing protein [Nocardia farcinica]MBF6434346.1 helix-turn-helix domain-containing protein [Nocardia farcinica]MBF6505431.1 helix-turn-helix domain-containing protein [Nocardia farcinica]
MSRTVLAGFDPDALVAAMKRAGMNVPKLAREAGIGVSTIRAWLSSTNPRLPQVHHLAKVAKVLNVELNELIVIPPNDRKLSYYRNILGLGQADLGRLAGLPTSTVSAVERGELVTLNDSVVAKLASVLRISESEFRTAYQRTRRPEKR